MTEKMNGDRVYVRVGQMLHLYMPPSNTCIRWGIAGQPVWVKIFNEWSADLIHDDGSMYPMPVTLGEAGISTEEGTGHLFVPTNSIVPTELGLPPPHPTLG